MTPDSPSMQAPLIVGASPMESAGTRDERRGRGRLAALVAVLVILGATLYQAYRARELCDGNFTYAEGAAYRHLAAGRTLAEYTPEYGLPEGENPLGVTDAPGWTLLLAGVLRLPILWSDGSVDRDATILVPLVLNLVAAALLVLLVGHLLRHDLHCGFRMLVALLAMAVLMPLPLLVLTGMEHTLHVGVLLGLIAAALALIERERLSVLLMLLTSLLGAAAVSLRYESLAAVFALLVWAKMRRRLMRFVLPTLVVAAAIAAIGIVLHRQGGSYLPNPMLIELSRIVGDGWRGAWIWLRERAGSNLQTSLLPWALLLIGSGLLCLGRDHVFSSVRADREQVGWLFVFVLTGVIHLLVGPGGEHFRYSAYLMALATVAILGPLAVGGDTGGRLPRAVGGRLILAVICILPLAMAAVPVALVAWSAPKVCRDVYGRERMMAWFVRTYFDGETVAVNRPGAIEVETEAIVVDLSGLTDSKVAYDRSRGLWNRATAGEKVSRAGAPVTLIVGNDDRSLSPAPSSWIEVGGWYPSGSSRDSASAVRVYATRDDPKIVGTVRSAVQTFGSKQLPKWLTLWVAGEASAVDTPSDGQPVRGEGAVETARVLSSR